MGNRNRGETPLHLQTAFKVILVLLTLVVAEGIGLGWALKRPKTGETRSFAFQAATTENLIQRKFPETDFSKVYPGLTKPEIDQLQRESLGVRYVYAPFVEFKPAPDAKRFVNVLPGGFRQGREAGPWPPLPSELVVFVFGGSTTFGFGLPDGETVVSRLEAKLAERFPGRKVRCYNFGRGYYFSSQERQLFESLLAEGATPQLAVFIDGLNEFVYHDGMPEFTPALYAFTAPDRPPLTRAEITSDAERASAVARLIARYRQNLRLIEAVAQAHGVSPIFVGQPVPFLDFPMRPETYPFQSTFAEHRLAAWGYKNFKDAARAGQFGERFVWCGNAFANAGGVMYADSIHYNAAGAEELARCIVTRAAEVGLIP